MPIIVLKKKKKHNQINFLESKDEKESIQTKQHAVTALLYFDKKMVSLKNNIIIVRNALQ